MQGVWHHVPVGYRPTWLSKLRAVLQSGGRLILSDEFVAPYKSEVQRRQHVVLFYLHVIGEAVKAGCEGLVFDESLNLLADVLYDYPHMRGVYNKELLDYIRSTAVEVNARLSPLSTSPLTIGEAVELSQDIVMRLLYLSVGLAKQDGQGRIDRGDYKTSVEAAVSEFTNVGWRCDLIRKIGPVDELGGMAVLVFR
jgi:hypothetical protein